MDKIKLENKRKPRVNYTDEPTTSGELVFSPDIAEATNKIIKGIRKKEAELAKSMRDKKLSGLRIIKTPEKILGADEASYWNRVVFVNKDNKKINKEAIIKDSKYKVYYDEEILESKHLVFLHFFEEENYHVGRALERMGLNRFTLSRWKTNNAAFLQIVDDRSEYIADDAEEVLINYMREGDKDAAKFLLENKGKDRGYGKQVASADTNINVNVVGFNFVNVNQEEEDIIDL